jgi:hypothetical protein
MLNPLPWIKYSKNCYSIRTCMSIHISRLRMYLRIYIYKLVTVTNCKFYGRRLLYSPEEYLWKVVQTIIWLITGKSFTLLNFCKTYQTLIKRGEFQYHLMKNEYFYDVAWFESNLKCKINKIQKKKKKEVNVVCLISSVVNVKKKKLQGKKL